MSDSGRHIADEEFLSVFADGDPREPRGTREVADALDCARRTAYERLDRLAEQGDLRTKKVGSSVRVWWLADAPGEEAGATEPDGDLSALAADYVLDIEFRSAALGRTFLDVSPDIEMRLDGIVERADGTVLQYLTVSNAPPRDLFETLEQYPHTIDLRLLSSHGDEYRIESHTTEDSLGKLFRSVDGTTKAAYLEDGEFVVVGEAPPTSDVADLAEAAASLYPDVELTGVELDLTPRLFRTVVEDDLTDRQWTALTAAYYGGYFEQPRESTGKEIAERLDIRRQTLHYHLRNVQRVVLRTLLEGLPADTESDPHDAGTLRSDE